MIDTISRPGGGFCIRAIVQIIRAFARQSTKTLENTRDGSDRRAFIIYYLGSNIAPKIFVYFSRPVNQIEVNAGLNNMGKMFSCAGKHP